MFTVSPYVFLFVWACLPKAVAFLVLPPFPILLNTVLCYYYFCITFWNGDKCLEINML